MMLVSLSSYCQYPLVKTIGKDTVVIMTVKQGEDINKKFGALEDSISAAKAQIASLEKQLVDQKDTFNIQVSNVKQTMEKDKEVYKTETQKLNHLLWSESKVARRHSIFLLVGVTAFTALVFIISK